MYPDLRLPQRSLADLPLKLGQAGYFEEALREVMGLTDLWRLNAEGVPGCLWRCRQDGTITGLLAGLFLLRQPVSRADFVEHVGEEETFALIEAGALREDGEALRAEVDLFPCLGRLVFTDHLTQVPQEEGHVYELGADSYALARVTPRRRQRRALDLCTGSGIHAILAAFHTDEVFAADINPRALAYSRVNAALNGRSNVTWLQSDLFEKVPPGPYDLITANPPFVPSPDSSVLVHRSAGETGEEVSERMVAALPLFLAPGGLFAMVLDYPVLRSSTYHQRLQQWLGSSSGWGVALLNFGTVPSDQYIQQHVGYRVDFASYQATYLDYLRSYDRLGIDAVGFAVVLIRRLAPGAPSWAVTKETLVPRLFLADRVQEWLDGVALVEDPSFAPSPDSRPRLSRHYRTVWRDREKTRGMLETADLEWCGPVALGASLAGFAERLDGRVSVRELLEEWGEAEVLAHLKALARHGAVDMQSCI